MPYELAHHEATFDFAVTGEALMPSLLGPEAEMLPSGVRLWFYDRVLAGIYVHGNRIGSGGKVLKTGHSRSFDYDDEVWNNNTWQSPPIWLKTLVASVTTDGKI